MKIVFDLLRAPDADTLERAANAASYFMRFERERERLHTYYRPMLIGLPESDPSWAVYETPQGAIVVRELENKTNG